MLLSSFRAAAVLLTALLPAVLCQDASSALSVYPECARGCIADAMSEGICAPTNQTCICTNDTFQGLVTGCVAQSCTLPDSLTTKNVSATNCNAPVRDKAQSHVVLTIAMIIMGVVFVAVRFIYKMIYMQTELGLDDWLILATIISTVPSACVTLFGTTQHGLGRDIWTVAHNDITLMLKYFYGMAILYFVETALVKLSIIAFYMRIFPARNTQRLLWGTFWFASAWGVCYVVLAIFQCRPVSYFWLKWDGLHEGQCLEANAIAWSNAIMNICLDVWILAVPLWELRSLQLHWKKKVGVALMFCVGTFVTVVSILRLQSLVHFATSSNITWEFYDVSVWSTIEICVGVACACLPTVRLLLVKIFPKLAGSTRRATDYYENRYGHASGNKSATHKSRNVAIVTADRDRRRRDSKGSADSPDGSIQDSSGGAGIVYQKTYAVQYSDNDEASLVRMASLDAQGRKS
ncbi:CFEM domain-containing protein [Emericellopsis cladophorae]|uniref:CFEM domain-containing protein n=1 Tax=Emericellopsis cladophorae TaxID=2686198 RepID=A0A9P9Y1K4_9HYPO|nr:CFEM domain-containing protein [Emericellopsis cladophorae]KAI6781621.1 CFEM domain-containing protein [Emericellopsis cladophorae]